MKISIAQLPGTVTRGILGFIYPPRCQICAKVLDMLSGEMLCETCHSSIRLNDLPVHNGCKTDTCHYDAFYSVCLYEGAIKECMHDFKYNGRFTAEKLFKKLMIEFAEKYIDIRRFDWLIPVPLHRVKQRQRTFNQSAILGACLSKRFRLPMLNGNLCRIRQGKPQMMLPKSKRLKEIKDSFRIKNTIPLKARTVLLVDDVFTTGATVNECSKVIKEAGARSVEVFTLARSA
jgi:ComF family protein